MRCQQMRTGRCFDVLLDYGEDINAPLRELAQREGISTAVVTAGLGGFNRFALATPRGTGISGRSTCCSWPRSRA